LQEPFYNKEVSSEVVMKSTPVAAIRRLQLLTIAWMCVEAGVSIYASARAHSMALLAFGGDSAIELLSACVVLLRFSGTELSESRASRVAAWLLLLLASFIAMGSTVSLLRPSLRPETSYPGISLLLIATLMMPWLAREKRKLAAQTSSSSLRADATQSAVCAYLAWIALAGLGLNALFHLQWADPAAALALIPFVLYEAREAWRGHGCACG
jgi:divalent metal cation (Fe/Co/Zn/Cd) transporter